MEKRLNESVQLSLVCVSCRFNILVGWCVSEKIYGALGSGWYSYNRL